MQDTSVIQILRKDPNQSGLNYHKILETNSHFCEQKNFEYIVYDNLQDFEVLKFVKNFPRIKYFRKEFKNLKQSFLESSLLSNSEKIIFLKSDDWLTEKYWEIMQTQRPTILKKDLSKIIQKVPENFKYANFFLILKDKKSILEKIRLLLNI